MLSIRLSVLLVLFAEGCLSYGGSSRSSLTYLDLASTEKELFTAFREFAKQRTLALNQLQSKIQLIRNAHHVAQEDLESYLSNPINAFSLIKRLVIDWPSINQTIALNSVAADFQRSWTSYKLQVMSVGRTELQSAIDDVLTPRGSNKNEISKLMSWSDCDEIGLELYKRGQYKEALYWFEQALAKFEDTQNFNQLLKPDLVKQIAICRYKSGKTGEAAAILDKYTKIYSSDAILATMKSFFQTDLHNIFEGVHFS